MVLQALTLGFEASCCCCMLCIIIHRVTAKVAFVCIRMYTYVRMYVLLGVNLYAEQVSGFNSLTR